MTDTDLLFRPTQQSLNTLKSLLQVYEHNDYFYKQPYILRTIRYYREWLATFDKDFGRDVVWC